MLEKWNNRDLFNRVTYIPKRNISYGLNEPIVCIPNEIRKKKHRRNRNNMDDTMNRRPETD